MHRLSLIFVLALLACGQIALAKSPWFCHDYDCPQFKVVKSAGRDLELREYEKTFWATTNVTGKKLLDAQSEGYRRLQEYLNQGNDASEKIDETNPVFTLLYPTNKAPERSVESNFTVEFFIPHKYQGNPPKPNRDDANVIEVESLQVYVQSFGGYATEEEIINRGYDLMDKVKQGGEEVYSDAFGFAQYDSLVRVVNRHNEVWVWLKQKPSQMPS